ncbi:hypothetical protein CSB93_0985 [Pseudomonas paraeruginosa]|uniref:Uncharacterized protein n=1 Tax=Pseudomonas paraeruginosa TaxID=2994495 RepID=A0A2R3J1U3_9PSED|nr:hypothetical protein CSB93_0985 [Pseudomonas paraeruginosa]AWE91229.1 hypothetical protein CSC28_6302 [Pseudomonas paraeruginosa]PTC33661.1 hypothetical protein CLJ1_5955 [Pseudomonas aeruginosa]
MTAFRAATGGRGRGQDLQATAQPLILKGLLATAHPHGPFS